mgnify:CR=1 FL=1
MALPSVFGLMVSVVYNLADTFFIAQSNDTALIAGVSLCAPVFTALMAFGNIYGQGGSSLISRLLGQDDREGTGRVSSFCFYVALTTGVVLAALMMLFRVPLLGILGATSETMPHAQAYYTVLAIGAPATVLNFIHSNLVRCEGMATQSMIGSIGGTVINIILRSHPHHHSGLGRQEVRPLPPLWATCAATCTSCGCSTKRAAACLSSCPSATSRAGSCSRFWAWVLLPR